MAWKKKKINNERLLCQINKIIYTFLFTRNTDSTKKKKKTMTIRTRKAAKQQQLYRQQSHSETIFNKTAP